MNRVSIRPALEADLEQITAIYADAVVNGTASYELDPPISTRCASAIARSRTAAFPILSRRLTAPLPAMPMPDLSAPRPAYRFIVEDSVYVAPYAKGRGIGRALMLRLIGEAQSLGFRQIIAVIGDGRPDSASVRLHEALGFRHSGRLEGSGYKHGRWLDTVFMQLSLNGGSASDPDPTSLPERRFRAS